MLAQAAWAVDITRQEDREIVAVVNGEEIFTDELMESLAARHQNMTGDTQKAGMGFESALDRLIDTKLILQEARDIGLEKRPEIRDDVSTYSKRLLLSILKGRQLKDLKADKADIESIYSDRIRTWSYKAITFSDLDQARSFREEVGDKGDFDSIGQKYVQDQAAAWDGEERTARERDLTPEITSAFVDKEVGSITPVIKALNRYYVFKLTGVSYPDDDASRLRAESMALDLKKEKVLDRYTDELLGKYVTIDEAVLSTVGKGDFSDMEKDVRVVATIRNEDPVRVADLIEHLKNKFYHGKKASDYERSLRSDPGTVLREFLQEKVFLKEAGELGLDQTDRYERSVTEYENSLLFGLYLEKFLAPQARVPEEMVREAYESRSQEFLMPQKINVDSVAFTDKESARKALDRIKRGADLKWISENTPGIAEEGLVNDELVFGAIPQDLQEKLEKASLGDVGMYDTGQGLYKVYVVRKVPPRQVQPYEKVRYQIATELFNERLIKAVEDLAAELREISEIEIYREKLNSDSLLKGRDLQ
jgi:hypothetical protein